MDVKRKRVAPLRHQSFSERLSSSLDPLKRPIRPKHARVASSISAGSEPFVASNSNVFRGQIIGGATKGREARNRTYLNHDDINRRAIQIWHTEGEENSESKKSIIKPFLRIIHPYDRFRRLFDVATVIWVLLLVFFIPLEIGFDWYETPSPQKVFYGVLDCWFAVDIILNFRTGYINHGTVVMDSKKIAS
mmetsp:Transcript_46182/g.97021  ORF Transcript_46182/g.97021 Transcript_46182/m.97021 type:complete len:191 (+) Transcript_46182:1936-2508(+)